MSLMRSSLFLALESFVDGALQAHPTYSSLVVFNAAVKRVVTYSTS